MKPSRREVLGVSVASLAAVSLAACAAEPEVAQTTPPSATVNQAPAEAVGEILLGPASEIMVGSGNKYKIDEMLTILVTQPKAGDFRGFSATCTHSGCIVSGVSDGEIACGCHGARFDQETGAVLAGPARTALGRITIELRGDELYAIV
ncbi:Rieske (2Fe-2S) protein [Aquiluna sp. KACHI24]|uniref:Rieske (2Fe-2S) protein n=1 Tax=Aquiluna sp. KACHI24 TaxID=2968831 RepID=UPI002209526F|nr:Rieske (2Fe-2S) protein [Aquiluna sp. KACHI24]BDP99912.1 iron-sulfur protein [Aquiluna sp. KACHI24]